MFLGHFGIGLAAKSKVPMLSLGTLFLAAQFVDLLWPTFLLLGWERVAIAPGITTVTPLDFTYYPISHSLLAATGWGILLGGIYLLTRRNRTGALFIGLLVVSHWFLDLLVHRPDLPLYPGGSLLAGFGLWNSTGATLLLEAAVFLAGIVWYLRSTRASDAIGKYGFWGLIAFLTLIYAGNVLGPPPPDVAAIAWAGHLQWLLVGLGYWVDGHRVSGSEPRSQSRPAR